LFSNLEKIEKTLYIPCRGLTLKNTVIIGNANKNKEKISPIWNKSFKTQKYSNKSEVTALNIRTSDFLVFTYSNDEKDFDEIYISYPHIEKIIKAFNEMKNILQTKDDLFIEENDELFVNADYENLAIKINDLTNGKSIVIVPSVIVDGTQEWPGVIIYLGKEDNFIEMNFEVYFSLVYFLNNFNLQLSSQLLLNFAGIYFSNKAGTVNSNSSVVRPPEKKVVNRKIKKSSNELFKEDPLPEIPKKEELIIEIDTTKLPSEEEEFDYIDMPLPTISDLFGNIEKTNKKIKKTTNKKSVLNLDNIMNVMNEIPDIEYNDTSEEGEDVEEKE